MSQVQFLRGATSETFLNVQAEQLPASSIILTSPGIRVIRTLTSDTAFPPVFMARLLKKLPAHKRAENLVMMAALRSARPDVVLAHYGPNGVAVRSAAQRLDIPLVVHFHGFDAWERATLKRYQMAYRQLFDMCAAVVVVAADMAEQVQRLGAPSEKVHVIPCGVDPLQFDGATPGEQPPTFLCVGRLVDKKAPHLSILAFSHAIHSVPEIRLRVVGNGPLRGACESLVKSLGIDHAVDFLGAQPHDAVVDEMRSARALVQHSVEASSGDREGSPVSVVEALMSGLPVIATRHAGIADAVDHGKTGLLCDEHDVQAMADALVTLATDSELAASMGAVARTTAIERFALERTIGDLRSVLEEACR